MRNCPRRGIRVLICGVAAVCFRVTAAVPAFASTCALTLPSEAINEGPLQTLICGGYRITGVRWDHVLRQRWVLAVRCDHPERPAIAIRLSKSNLDAPLVGQNRQEMAANPVAVPLLVRAGEAVQLWRQEDNVRIAVSGVSEEGAGLGKTVRVRVLGTNSDGRQEYQLTGIVRGPGNVEMER
jgi:hypothetical protein